MARTKSGGNGRVDRLEEAHTTLTQAHAALALAQANLVQAQAALTAQHTAFLARMAETDRINSERFARIEAILMDHSRILMDHSRILMDHTRILEALPDAIRDKIGFKSPTPQATK